MFDRLKNRFAARFPVAAAMVRAGVDKIIGPKAPALPAPAQVSDQTVAEVSANDNVLLTKIKSTGRTPEGWATIFGAVVTLVDQVGPAVGIVNDKVISEAVETVTSFVGLPDGSGRAAVALFEVGSFVFLFIRKKFFAHTVSPEAADRAVKLGKAA